MTANEHLSAILRELNRDQDVVPGEWKTARQLAKEWGCSESHGIRLCNARVREGAMQVQTFRIRSGSDS